MSAAEDLRTALLDYSALDTAVGGRVRQDMGDADDDYPFVIFRQTRNEPIRSLDGTLLARAEDFQIESWGATRAASYTVHALVEAALLAADIECDPADPDALDPEVGAKAGVWNVRIWTT